MDRRQVSIGTGGLPADIRYWRGQGRRLRRADRKAEVLSYPQVAAVVYAQLQSVKSRVAAVRYGDRPHLRVFVDICQTPDKAHAVALAVIPARHIDAEGQAGICLGPDLGKCHVDGYFRVPGTSAAGEKEMLRDSAALLVLKDNVSASL